MAKYASVLFKSLFATLIEGRIEKKIEKEGRFIINSRFARGEVVGKYFPWMGNECRRAGFTRSSK